MNDMQTDFDLDVSELPEMQHAFAEIRKEFDQTNEEDTEETIEHHDEPEDESENIIEGNEEQEIDDENQEEHSQEEENNEIDQEHYRSKEVKKLRQYRQEKNDLIAQREYLREENERLKKSLRDQEYSAKYSQGENIYNQLDYAVNLKRKALEEGDVEEIVRADINLIKAQNKVAELEEWIEEEKNRIEQSSNENPSIDPQETLNQQVVQQISHEWLKENPDLNPRSIYYDAAKANNVKGFIDYLDRYLVEENLQHLYYTPEYFDKIDEYKHSIPSSQKKTGYSAVAPVRNNATVNSQKSQKQTITLSAQEKMMAHNMGITPEEWLKYKIEQYQEGNRHA